MILNVHENPTVGIDDEEMFFQFLRTRALQSNNFDDIVPKENSNEMILVKK